MIGGLHNPTIPDFPLIVERGGTRWMLPGWFISQPFDCAIVSGLLIYIPIFVTRTTAFIRIGINVTVAGPGGSLARLGIYRWSAGRAGGLILDAGTVSIAAIAAVEIVIAQTLGRGYYFLAVVTDNNCSLRGPDALSAIKPPVDGFVNAITSPAYIILSKSGEIARVAGGLPDPAPAPDSSQNIPWAVVMLRDT